MTNVNKLKGKLKEKNLTIVEYAKKIGVNSTSTNYKVNGKKKFNQEEIEKSIEILNLCPNEIIDIFFNHKVEKTQQN